MKLDFRGGTHAAQTYAKAAELRGFALGDTGDIVFVALDVEDHEKLDEVNALMARTIDDTPVDVPLVVLSQVPPGWTRKWSEIRPDVFYQQNTLIISSALERALHPERFVIGCDNSWEPLPAVYQAYLDAFECPVIRMSYESAELSKLAVNYLLASQINTAQVLSAVADAVGASWDEMMPGLRLDKRIGEHAYIRPGEIGGHLPRDLRTVNRLIQNHVKTWLDLRGPEPNDTRQ